MSLTVGLLALFSVYVGVVFILMGLSERPLPEWLFPVRGRWLKYFLLGFGSLLSLPVLLPFALTLWPLFLVWGCCELVLRSGGGRTRPGVDENE